MLCKPQQLKAINLFSHCFLNADFQGALLHMFLTPGVRLTEAAFILKIFNIKRKKPSMSTGGAERGGDTEFEGGSRL